MKLPSSPFQIPRLYLLIGITIISIISIGLILLLIPSRPKKTIPPIPSTPQQTIQEMQTVKPFKLPSDPQPLNSDLVPAQEALPPTKVLGIKSCVSNTDCNQTETCLDNTCVTTLAQTKCQNGHSCPMDYQCTETGCIPQNAQHCGGTAYCLSGYYCTNYGATYYCKSIDPPSSNNPCGNGFCANTQYCQNNQCIDNDAKNCGNGLCDKKATCTPTGCLPPDTHSCNNGGGFCLEGYDCLNSTNQCLKKGAIICGNGKACDQGTVCSENGCCPESAPYMCNGACSTNKTCDNGNDAITPQPPQTINPNITNAPGGRGQNGNENGFNPNPTTTNSRGGNNVVIPGCGDGICNRRQDELRLCPQDCSITPTIFQNLANSPTPFFTNELSCTSNSDCKNGYFCKQNACITTTNTGAKISEAQIGCSTIYLKWIPSQKPGLIKQKLTWTLWNNDASQTESTQSSEDLQITKSVYLIQNLPKDRWIEASIESTYSDGSVTLSNRFAGFTPNTCIDNSENFFTGITTTCKEITVSWKNPTDTIVWDVIKSGTVSKSQKLKSNSWNYVYDLTGLSYTLRNVMANGGYYFSFPSMNTETPNHSQLFISTPFCE